ncbi:hypothetical protein [Rhodovulum sp. YEN HP10]|uniref:hypothetical protein n=1 Tax=Rhodovulum sp. HP10 TaxID=3387397 RepID=UPI0039E112E6
MGELTKIPQEDAATPASFGAITPMGMISQAVANGAGIETVERLIALHERWESGRARKAFDTAISADRRGSPYRDAADPGAARAVLVA